MPRQKIYTDNPNNSLNEIIEFGHTPEGAEIINDFHANQDALNILTSTDFQDAAKKVRLIADRIRGKRVIEIGAGVGFLAIQMAKIATKVTAIESDPGFNWVFTKHLYKTKPTNLTWVFGDAQDFRDSFIFDKRPQVAVVFTRSGIDQMRHIASQFADEVIMFYQEYDE